ncbi:MAG: sugar phosphate isomerase/epimerase [Clostridia bacterium]|nr:sugar phosphate isomerase/epimerase [Clostridia bacterium]
MNIGASSACFYPLETEKSFRKICEMGFSHSEIFFNSHSELNPDFLKEIIRTKNHYGVTVTSLHPYRSFSEGYDFFSEYKRRFYDAMEDYKKYFSAAAELGARYIVMHGSKGKREISLEEYAERFGELNRIAEAFGCTVAHENVVNFASATPDFMRFMKSYLGNSFKAVLDVKQARRAGFDYKEFIDVLGENIVHVHLSDFDTAHDCIPPSEKGLFDFSALFTDLKNIDYKGDGIVELYSDGYKDSSEIVYAAEYLRKIADNVFNQTKF